MDEEPEAMKTVPFALVWIFIILAAGYDTYFAWQNRDSFHLWEMNALICWMARQFGLGAVFGFKGLGMVLVVGLALYCHRLHPRLEICCTLIVGCAYLLLSLHYLVGFMA
jgi:hypothetical protein